MKWVGSKGLLSEKVTWIFYGNLDTDTYCCCRKG